MNDRQYVTNADGLSDLQHDISELALLSGAAADHTAVSGLSANPPVAALLGRISETMRRNTLDRGAAGPPRDGAMPGGEPADRKPKEVVFEPQEEPVTPSGAPLELPLVEPQLLQ